MHSAINFSSTTKCLYDEIGRHIGLKIQALLGVPVRVWLEAPVDENKIVSTTKSLQSVYDNVYDMIPCIRLRKEKVAVAISNNDNSRLKILALLGVPVRVWPRAPIKMYTKAHIIFDKTKSSLKILSDLKKIFIPASLNNANLFIVIGGDGYMLKTLKKFYKYKKPFYGINSGSYGFLMNKFSRKNFLKNLKKTRSIAINPLIMMVKKKNNQNKKSIAINEVSILRQTRQAAKLSIKSGNKIISRKLISDGVLVSSPAGSTAYNLSVHGPILNLDSKKLSITPISPFRPRRWRGTIVNEKSKIIIKNLDCKKRPISAVADNFEVKNAKSVKIQINKKIKFILLYNRHSSLEKKIKLEQIRKETKSN